VVVGAPPTTSLHLLRFPVNRVEAVGGGADGDTRGRVCSPEMQKAPALHGGLLRPLATQMGRIFTQTQSPLPQRFNNKRTQSNLVLTQKTGLF
jgi:hypothetical protein